MTDSSIWDLLKAGDIHALRMLYDCYADDLYTYGMMLNRDDDRVRDHIHDLFISLWNSRENITTPVSTKAYLMASFRRRMFDKGSKTESVTQLVESYEDISPGTEGPEELMISREIESLRQEKLSKAIGRLSARQQEILHMKYFQDMEYEEIGRIMELNYQSARNLLTRAIAALRKEMLAAVIILLMLG